MPRPRFEMFFLACAATLLGARGECRVAQGEPACVAGALAVAAVSEDALLLQLGVTKLAALSGGQEGALPSVHPLPGGAAGVSQLQGAKNSNQLVELAVTGGMTGDSNSSTVSAGEGIVGAGKDDIWGSVTSPKGILILVWLVLVFTFIVFQIMQLYKESDMLPKGSEWENPVGKSFVKDAFSILTMSYISPFFNYKNPVKEHLLKFVRLPFWKDVPAAHERMNNLYEAEKARVGQQNVNMSRIVLRDYLGYKVLVYVGTLTAVAQCFEFLFPMFVVNFMVAKIDQLAAQQGDPGIPQDLFGDCVLVVVTFFVLPMLGNMLNFVVQQVDMTLSFEMQGAIACMMYRKAQRLPVNLESVGASTEKELFSGKHSAAKFDLVQLISVDAFQNLQKCIYMICTTLIAPVICTLILVFIAFKIKLAMIFVLLTIIPFLGGNLMYLGPIGASFMDIQKYLDLRLSRLQEILVNIRLVKAYAWEEPMKQQLCAIREMELASIERFQKGIQKLNSLVVAYPRLVCLVAVTSYVLIYKQLDAKVIFPAVSALNSMTSFLMIVSQSLTQFMKIKPSLQRFDEFMKLPSISESGTMRDPTPGGAVLELRGNFSWKHDGSEPMLQDIDLSFERGASVAILGEVGSGKTTLLHAFLGEMFPSPSWESCRITKPPLVAYCQQSPWIFEGTVRGNVLLGAEEWKTKEEEALYWNCIEACSLTKDLGFLAKSDLTEIGSRGIMLSGGQKARVSLARATYTQADLVLLDDPFAALDVETGAAVIKDCVFGDVMRHMTRVVVMQPDSEKLKYFDQVIVLSKGKVVEKGAPSAVVKTAAYAALLAVSTADEGQTSGSGRNSGTKKTSSAGTSAKEQQETLMEDKLIVQFQKEQQHFTRAIEESSGLITWETFLYWFRMGQGWKFIAFLLMLFSGAVCGVGMDQILAKYIDQTNFWINKPEFVFILIFATLMILCGLLSRVGGMTGVNFMVGVSKKLHTRLLNSVMRGRTDLFFDKQPVGRIVNRFSNDLQLVDTILWLNIGQATTVVCTIGVPLLFILTLDHWYLTVICLPFYFLMWPFFAVYMRSIVPMNYQFRHGLSNLIASTGECVHSKVSVRAFNCMEKMHKYIYCFTDQVVRLHTCIQTGAANWLVMRTQVCMAAAFTMHGLFAVHHPLTYGVGGFGFVLTTYFGLLGQMRTQLNLAIEAKVNFTAVRRIKEFDEEIPHEAASELPGDERRWKYTVEASGKSLEALGLVIKEGGSAGGFHICRRTQDGREQPVLVPAPSGGGLMAAPFSSIATTFSDVPGLCDIGKKGRIMKVGDEVLGDSRKLAEALCSAKGDTVPIEVLTGWMIGGASLELKNIVAQYAQGDPVLKGITLKIEPGQKVAIAGATGSGKSTLMQVLLRTLELKSGQILFDGVDTRKIGLLQLRSTLGIVPQDPVLFAGTLRYNMDPQSIHTDEQVWEAMGMVHMQEYAQETQTRQDQTAGREDTMSARTIADFLSLEVSAGASNMSLGQQQLLCIGRMVLRQPSILLLDEATSALDPHTQQLVQSTIKAFFPESTLIAIAHRLETVLDFDTIVLLSGGEVLETGPMKELQKRPGSIFARMVAQSKAGSATSCAMLMDSMS